MARNTYKYHFKVGNKIIYSGITDDLVEQERDLQHTLDSSGRIAPVGDPVAKDAALQWESEQAARGRPTRRNRMADVVKMVDVTDNIRTWAVEEMLEYSLEKIRNGDFIPANKAVLIMLNDRDGVYDVRRCSAGLKCSEILSMLEVEKSRVLKMMGYPQE